MVDVWRELEERLKQKAKTLAQIEDMRDSEVKKVAFVPATYNEMMERWMQSKWVRLEDVLSILQQLKQNIVDEIIELIHRLEREIGLMVVDGLGADITDSFIQNLKEELLKN